MVGELNNKVYENDKRHKDDLKKKISALREDFDQREDDLL